jgi:oxygen-independent coproporphyrinogen III oxidase
MAGLYFHIPFCRKACHYCDFHFSTSMAGKELMVEAIIGELHLKSPEWNTEIFETIYFGGGTPSVLSEKELGRILEVVNTQFSVVDNPRISNIKSIPEITLEANPDDLDEHHLESMRKVGINRLSIGIQSFFDEELKFMNRSHDAAQAMTCISKAKEAGFEDISVDLIYGISGSSNQKWIENVERVLDFGIPHISAYALTVEPKTAFYHQIKKGTASSPKEEEQEEQFTILVEILKKAGFVHYEISNFCKPGFQSKHNSAYWDGVPYLGIGPSAHTFQQGVRSWNVSNNAQYIQGIENKTPKSESEVLTSRDIINEYIMTGLRRLEGLSIRKMEGYPNDVINIVLSSARAHIDAGRLILAGDNLYISEKHRFLADGIASDLFLMEGDI